MSDWLTRLAGVGGIRTVEVTHVKVETDNPNDDKQRARELLDAVIKELRRDSMNGKKTRAEPAYLCLDRGGARCYTEKYRGGKKGGDSK